MANDSEIKSRFARQYSAIRANPSNLGGSLFVGPGQPGLPYETFMGIQTGVGAIGSSPLARIQLYKRAIWVYACTEARVVPISRVPLKLYQHTPDDKHNEVMDHPILDTLIDVNPNWDTASTIRANTERSLCIHGRYHWLKVRNQGGIVRELYGLPVQFTQIIPNRDNLTNPIDVFRYQPGNWRRDYSPQDIVYFRYGTPEQDVDGFAPLMVAIETTQSDISLQVAQNAMSSNAARPSVVMTVKPKWSQADFQARTEELNRKYAGAVNAGKIMVLDNAENVTFNKVQLTPAEMEWIKEHQEHAGDICVAFRVPPMIANDFSDASRLANAGAGHRFYWENTLIPELSLWEDVLNWQLLWTEDWGRGGHKDSKGAWYSWEKYNGYYLQHDLTGIQALREDENARSTRARNSFGLALSIDEIREMLGYDPLDDESLGSTVFISNTLVPADTMLAGINDIPDSSGNETGADAIESEAQMNSRGSNEGTSSLKTDLADSNNLTRPQDARPGASRSQMLTELKKWKKVAEKDPLRALQFKSDILPLDLQAEIRQSLSENGNAAFLLPDEQIGKKKVRLIPPRRKIKFTVKSRISNSTNR